jgi:hypothetical protein
MSSSSEISTQEDDQLAFVLRHDRNTDNVQMTKHSKEMCYLAAALATLMISMLCWSLVRRARNKPHPPLPPFEMEQLLEVQGGPSPHS